MNYHLDDKGNPMDSAWYMNAAWTCLLDAKKANTDPGLTALQSNATLTIRVAQAQVYATLAQAEALRELTEATEANRRLPRWGDPT